MYKEKLRLENDSVQVTCHQDRFINEYTRENLANISQFFCEM